MHSRSEHRDRRPSSFARRLVIVILAICLLPIALALAMLVAFLPVAAPLFGIATTVVGIVCIAALLLWNVIERYIVRPLEMLRYNVPGDGAVSAAPLSELTDLGRLADELSRQERTAREALERAQSERAEVLRELNHRVRNNFQVISSLLDLQARYGTGDERLILRGPQRRVRAIALAYRSSFANGEIERVPLDSLLDDLAAEFATRTYGDQVEIRVEHSSTPVTLHLDEAVPLCLIVTEIVSAWTIGNANRRMTLALEASPRGDHATLTISDRGDYPMIVPLSERLIEAFRHQLSGTLDRATDSDGDPAMLLSFPTNVRDA